MTGRPSISPGARTSPTTLRRAALAAAALVAASAVAALAAPGQALGHDTAPDYAGDGRAGVGRGVDDQAWNRRLIVGFGTRGDHQPSPSAARVRELPADVGSRGDDVQVIDRPTSEDGHEVRVRGRLSGKRVGRTVIEPSEEGDGAIPLARTLGLGASQRAVSVSGVIGDGPEGSQGTATGDYDFYRFRARATDSLTVDVDPGGGLVPQAYLYDDRGRLVAAAQTLSTSGDVHLFQPLTRAGTYYLALGTFRPADPFDPGSGPAVLTEGAYTLDLDLRGPRKADTDTYAIALEKGDVVGATVTGSARNLAIRDGRGRLVQGSQVDIGAVYPDSSPLPRGGRATVNHVVERSGVYHLSVADGRGTYAVTIGVRHPDVRARQTIWLDFTGPTFDNEVFGESVVSPGVRTVSPMRDFLPAWGLSDADEAAVIEATTRRVEQVLRRDLPGSRVRVVSSADRPSLFGRPGVSRVIIGGTVEEVGGIDAFGMSESIDPGNFARRETAIVMPERMTGTVDPRSLLRFLTSESDRVRAVAQALGNTAAHEAGHFLGSYHTDDHGAIGVMNTGLKLHFYATGPDRVAGTDDDERLAMGVGRYDLLQGLAGREDTVARTRAATR